MASIVDLKTQKALAKSIKPTAVTPWSLPEKARAANSVREVREVSESRMKKLPRGTKVASPAEEYEEHRESRLVVAGGKELKPCRRTGKGTGPDRLRACHVELDWLSAGAAATIGSKAGPHLRFCSTLKEPALLVPVTSPSEASRLSREFCKCVGPDVSAGKRATCARDVTSGLKPAEKFGGFKGKKKKKTYNPYA